jgi:hypothetical protein
MDTKQIKENAEIIALCNYLSSYPADMSYDTIIGHMETKDPWQLADLGIDIWQPFESYDPHDIARYINDLYESVVYRFTLKESTHGSIHSN